jgi:hypothetical protein
VSLPDDEAWFAAYHAWYNDPGNEQKAKAYDAECQRVAMARGISSVLLRIEVAAEARKEPGKYLLPKVQRKRKVKR